MYVWGKPRGHNLLDSGHHFYETYITKGTTQSGFLFNNSWKVNLVKIHIAILDKILLISNFSKWYGFLSRAQNSGILHYWKHENVPWIFYGGASLKQATRYLINYVIN